MNKKRYLKRWISMMLAFILAFANIGSSVGVAFGSDDNTVAFVIGGGSLVQSVETLLEQGGTPVTPDELNFTDGDLEKYEKLFFDQKGGLALYEFYPEFDQNSSEVQLRSFIRLPRQLDSSYVLTGEEEILFLYINNGDTTVRCGVTVILDNGEEVSTKKVEIGSYDAAFGEDLEQMPSKAPVQDTEPKVPGTGTAAPETTAPETTAPETTAPETTAPETTAPETTVPETTAPEITAPETTVPETTAPETTVPETTAGTSAPETQAPETTAPGTSASEPTAAATSAPEPTAAATSAPEPTAAATSAPESPAPETAAPEPPAPEKDQIPAVSRSRHNVSVVASSQPLGDENNRDEKDRDEKDFIVIEDNCTAKVFITTLNELKALDDVDGFKVMYKFSPSTSGYIVEPENADEETKGIRFGVRAYLGYAVELVSAAGKILIMDSRDGDTAWYTLPEDLKDQEVLITMTETMEHPEFFQMLKMEDGMDITITADAGILPAGVVATADRMPEKDSLIQEAITAEGLIVTASPVYDINLWFEGEKLDNAIWSQNGFVRVSFSGELMEEISRNSDQLQVVWVKEEAEGESQSPADLVEVVDGTQVILNDTGEGQELSWEADHFTEYSPVGVKFANGPGRTFSIEELMDSDYPKLEFLTKGGEDVDAVISDKNEVTLADGTPLPRDTQIIIQLSYGLGNSAIADDHNYAVKAGDRFTYKYPSNIGISTKNFDVKENNDVIGTGVVQQGVLTILITKEDIGTDFKGTVDLYGFIDWENADEDNGKVIINFGDIEYTVIFEPKQDVGKYSAALEKTSSDIPYNESDDTGDIKYDEKTGLPSAVRYHVSVQADKDNSDKLTFSRDGMYLYDSFTKYDQNAYFDLNSLEITYNSLDGDTENTVEKAEFFDYGPQNKKTHFQRIYFKDMEGNYASLLPGQQVKISYWVTISPELWNQPSLKPGDDDYASSKLNLENTIWVYRDKKNIAEAKYEMAVYYNWIKKVGSIREIDGKMVTQYYIFVNPDQLHLSNWTIKDIIGEKQRYRKINIYAFDDKDQYVNPQSLAEEHRVDTIIVGDQISWEYRIKPENDTDYLVFEYISDIDGTPEELTNQVLLISPAGTTIGGKEVRIPYSSYHLTKVNANTRMDGLRPILQVKWNDSMGEILWKSQMVAYQNGDTGQGTIGEGHTYTDTLSVVDSKGTELDEDLKKLHSFESKEELKLVVKNGKSEKLTPDTDYSLELSDDRLSFEVKFLKETAAPVTLEYVSHVKDFTAFGNQSVLFKNKAEHNYGQLSQTAYAYQPYAREYYLDKEVGTINSTTGIVEWNLIVNKGYNQHYKMSLRNRVADIVEELPQGMELVEISYKGNVLKEGTADGAAYELQNGNIIIHLNQIDGIMKEDNKIETETIVIKTRVVDPSRHNEAFENKATMIIDGMPLSEARAQVQIDHSFLEKGMEYNQQTAPVAKYTLLVNKEGAKISRLDDGTLEVSDELGDPAMSYVSLGSFKILNAGTNQVITQAQRKMTANGRGFTITNLPDETPIIIQYEVAFSGNVGDRIQTSNLAQLKYSDKDIITSGHEGEIIIRRAVATGEGNPYIVIHKEDQDGNPLEGAEFTLYRMEKENGSWKQGEAIRILKPSGADASAVVKDIVIGQVYYLQETKVPEGYGGASGIYFAIPGDSPVTDYPEGTQLWYTGVDYTFVNTRITGESFLTGRKTLTGRILRDQEFTFDVYEEDRLVTTGKNRVDGTIVFDNVTYTEADIGLHTYRISERVENLPYVTYDPTVYMVMLEVGMIKGEIYTQVIGTMLENETLVDEVLFNNSYNPPGGGGGGGGGTGGGPRRTTTTIAPEDIPLAQAPATGEEDVVSIVDEEVPLAGLPKTGEKSPFGIKVLFTSILLGAFAIAGRKKEEK